MTLARGLASRETLTGIADVSRTLAVMVHLACLVSIGNQLALSLGEPCWRTEYSRLEAWKQETREIYETR
jgi:hypothetical protein